MVNVWKLNNGGFSGFSLAASGPDARDKHRPRVSKRRQKSGTISQFPGVRDRAHSDATAAFGCASLVCWANGRCALHSYCSGIRSRESGIAILPETAAGTDTSGFVTVAFNNRFANRQIELLQRRDATLSPASESLMRHLLQKLHARKREDRSAASANVKRKLKNS